MTPEERARYKELRAHWDEQRREFEDVYERWLARWQEDVARKERRRRLLRRLLPFGRAA